MRKVLLFHGGQIPHYRIGVYDYLHDYLKKNDYYLKIISEGHQADFNIPGHFPEIRQQFSLRSLVNLVRREKPWAVILFINHRARYFFPFLLYLRLAGYRVATWTHGINLQRKHDVISRIFHHLEHSLCQRIILYSEQQKEYLLRAHRSKAFVAYNTLNLTDYNPYLSNKSKTLDKYKISTKRNIVYSGKIEERKRVRNLIQAFELIQDEDIGLVLIGPDKENLLKNYKNNPRIYYLGPLYGLEALDVLSACDVCCIPGAVGLGIVDSMYCGLPLITERVDHGPEIMYFREGVNGFMVPRGDINALAEKLRMVLQDEELRKRLGDNARQEILTRGHINNLCAGFLRCLSSLEVNNKI